MAETMRTTAPTNNLNNDNVDVDDNDAVDDADGDDEDGDEDTEERACPVDDDGGRRCDETHEGDEGARDKMLKSCAWKPLVFH